jgi:hypothetical protein
LNREAPFPDNGHASLAVSILMREEDGNTRLRLGGADWPRRVVVGLWVVAFVLGGGVLSARWDVLMTRLARPPVGDVAAGGR